MRFLSRSDRGRAAPPRVSALDSGSAPDLYDSVVTVQSKVMPAVTFVINRISFGRRMDLSRRAREISKKAEFLAAGSQET